MMVVGCDFGLVKSGIVVIDEQFNLHTQTLIRTRAKAGWRLIEIEDAFDMLIEPYRDNLTVVVEGYAYGAKYQRESLAELGGVMRRYFCKHNLDYWVVPPTMLKSYVTGSGRASKNYVKKCTKDKWGLTFKSDDVCDAHGLARLGITALTMSDAQDRWDLLDEHEYEVVNELLTNKENYLNANTARRKRRK